MKTKGRRDHYLPQGYLRGFINPAREQCQQPLWHFDVPRNLWSEKSPREIGHRPGFYDYATNAAGLKPADETFKQLEQRFPLIREKIESDFESWTDHLDFLLRFMQMMRARSLLFFEQHRQMMKNMPTWRVKEVLPDGKSIKLESMKPEPPPPHFIQNRAILDMQAEIEKGAAWANDYTWTMQYTDTPDEPFIISESPVVSTSTAEKRPLMIVLPISWKAGLFGTDRDFKQPKTNPIDIYSLRQIRAMYRRGANLYLVSPKKLDSF